MRSNTSPLPKGFTLIELMIVVAVIGILAAVAIPKFADLMNKGKESTVKSNLGALRSALSIYYGDNEIYPSDMTVGLTTDQKYFKEIPMIKIPSVLGNPGHVDLTGVTSALNDGGAEAWIYMLNAHDTGQVLVNCSHPDSKSNIWSTH